MPLGTPPKGSGVGDGGGKLSVRTGDLGGTAAGSTAAEGVGGVGGGGEKGGRTVVVN